MPSQLPQINVRVTEKGMESIDQLQQTLGLDSRAEAVKWALRYTSARIPSPTPLSLRAACTQNGLDVPAHLLMSREERAKHVALRQQQLDAGADPADELR